jgi:hypothetical protein
LEQALTKIRDGMHDEAVDSPGAPLGQLLVAILLNPQKLLRLWNWKSAWLSILLRAPIFFGVTVRRGFAATIGAVLTECVYCGLTAGFYGALVQTLRDATPEWLTGVFLAAVVPVLFQAFEVLLHYLRGTPHLWVAEIISLSVAAISALFNWYAMRRGALLVGGEGRSFGSDLIGLPILFFNFIALGPRKLLARPKSFNDSSNGSGESP